MSGPDVRVLLTAVQAVSQVLILAGAGAWLELKGEMGKTRRGGLSNLAYRVLLPCLMFGNVTESISAEALARLFCVPLYALIYIAIGWILGEIVGRRVCKADDEFGRTHFVLTTALGNHGYIPLILVPSVIYQGSLHEPGTNLASAVKDGVAYISLFILVVNIITWSVATTALKRAGQQQRAAEAKAAASKSADACTLPSVPTVTVLPELQAAAAAPAASPGAAVAPPKSESEAAAEAWQKWLSRHGVPGAVARPVGSAVAFVTAVVTPPVFASFSGACIGMIPPLKALLFVKKAAAIEEEAVAPFSAAFEAPAGTCSNASTAFTMLHNATGWFLCDVATAACCTQLQALAPPVLLAAASSAASAPLVVAPLGPTIATAVQSLGSAVTPVVAVTLGSNIVDDGNPNRPPLSMAAAWAGLKGRVRGLLSGQQFQELEAPAATGGEVAAAAPVVAKPPAIRRPVLGCIIFIRLVAMPAIGIMCVAAGCSAGIIQLERTLVFVLLVQASTPPAMNLQLIADRMGSGGRAMSRVIAASYITSALSLTVWISIFLTAIKMGSFGELRS